MTSRNSDPRNSSTLLAFMGLLFVAVGFLGFTALLFPGFAIVVLVLFLMVSLQYLVWGWWFPRIRRPDDGDE